MVYSLNKITQSNNFLKLSVFFRVYALSYEYSFEMFEFINEYGLEGEILC